MSTWNGASLRVFNNTGGGVVVQVAAFSATLNVALVPVEGGVGRFTWNATLVAGGGTRDA